MTIVIAFVRQFALLIALFGLVGQSAAFASPPCEFMAKAEMAQSSDMGSMDDCMKGAHKTDKGSQPCKGMTPGCMAMAGCVSLPAFNSTAVAIRWPAFAAQNVIALPNPPLLGRSVPPDLRPPAILV
jgi:hypothetical protein